MRRLAKLILSLFIGVISTTNLYAQCTFLSGNSEVFSTSSVCAPVTVSWDIQYSFITMPPASQVYFRFEWNDPANTVQDIQATCIGSDCSPSSGTQLFTYPSGLSNCEYSPRVTLAVDANMNGTIESNELCPTSERNKTIRSWDTDNTGTGILSVNPSYTEQCVGVPLNTFQIQDVTIPNCASFSVTNPNQLNRWVQFVYGDVNSTSPQIPNVSIDTGGGTVEVTDNNGNLIAPFYGPVIEIPPLVSISDLNELSYPLSFGTNTTIGEGFRITLRNWNICNPYDSLLFNGQPPADPVNGDYPPEIAHSDIVIIGPTVAQAGFDQEICGNSTFLSGNIANVGTGQWSQVSGPGSLIFNDAGAPNTAVNFTGSTYGTYDLQWLINLGSCVSMDTVEVIFNPNSTVPVCGPDQNVCGLSTNLMANAINIGYGYWVQVGGPTGLVISDTSDPQSLISGINYGTYTLEWRSKNANCPEQSDQIDITFDQNPSAANAGVDFSTCGNIATLNGVTPNVGSGIWTVISSPQNSNPTFTNIGSPNSVLQIDSFGVYTLLWTVTNGVCNPTFDTVNVTFIPNPSMPNAGTDQDVCGSTTILSGNTPLIGSGNWVQVSGPGSITFTDSANPQTQISTTTFGTYILEWQISNANCVILTDQVNIDFFETPSNSNAGTDQQICGNNTVLNAAQISVGTGAWTLVNSPTGSNPFIANPVNRNTVILVDSFGTYSLTWSVSNGVCNPSVDTVNLNFYQSPGIPVAGPDQFVCGQSTNLQANFPDAGIGTWVQVAGPSGLTIANANDPLTSISSTNYGTYILEWRFSNTSCPTLTDQIQITFDQNPTNADAGPDKLICGTSTTLEALNLSIGTGQWSVVSSPIGSTASFSNIAANNSNLNIDSFGVYILKWTSSNGSCPSSDDNVKISFVEVPDYTVLSQTDATCYGALDATLSLQGINGTAPYYFTITGNQQFEGSLFTDLGAGNYQVTVTDQNGCQNTGTVNIDEADSISVSVNVTDASCGLNDGSIEITSITGGTGNISFQWNNGEITQNLDTLANLVSGFYLATIRDLNNCVKLFSVAVSDVSGPSVNVNSVTPVSCYGLTDGKIDLSIGAGNSINWSNGEENAVIDSIPAGPYFVFVRDSSNCKTIRQFNVSQPESMELLVNVSEPECGLSDGSASVLVNGGNGSYTINWSSGGMGTSVNALSAGLYNVTASDFKGCSITKNFTISDGGAPFIFTDSIVNVICGSNTGSIFISTTGNSANHSYLWSNNDTTEDLINVPVGNYTLEVTDTLGCMGFYNRDLIQETAIIPEICMVTVGTLDSGGVDNANTILWEKPADTAAYSEVRVYRETTSSGVYQQIGSVSAKSGGEFKDSLSNAFLKSYRYKISIVDTCGVESSLSDFHKTIHLVQVPGIQPNTVNLLWDDYEGFSYSTIFIYRNSQQNGWELIDSVSSNTNSYTDSFNVLDPDLFYTLEIESPFDCDPDKDEDYNRSRSNPSSALFSPQIIGLSKVSDLLDSIKIFPVPSSDKVFIKTTDFLNEIHYSIINLKGIEIENDIYSSSGINIKDYNKGFYVIKIYSKGTFKTFKLIKN